MDKKLCSFLLILCVVFSEGIGTSSEENIKNSSTLLIRKKRIIDWSPNGNQPVELENYRHIVSIQTEGLHVCGGSILSATVIITAAHCVDDYEEYTYTVESGVSHLGHGIIHRMKSTPIISKEYNTITTKNDLALFAIDPAIDFKNSINRPIMLYKGRVSEGVSASFSGWGCTYPVKPGEDCIPSETLRAMNVTIIPLKICARTYVAISPITETNICTIDLDYQRVIFSGDSGGPLTLKNQLIGVMSWIRWCGKPKFPDVFTNLLHLRSWIVQNIRRLHRVRSETEFA